MRSCVHAARGAARRARDAGADAALTLTVPHVDAPLWQCPSVTSCRASLLTPRRPLILRKTFFGMELPLGNPLMAIMFLGCYALGAYGTGLPEGKILGNQPRYALVGD